VAAHAADGDFYRRRYARDTAATGDLFALIRLGEWLAEQPGPEAERVRRLGLDAHGHTAENSSTPTAHAAASARSDS
jgi:hypothetical protein